MDRRNLTLDDAGAILDQTNNLLKPLAMIYKQIDTNLEFLQSLTLPKGARDSLQDFIHAVSLMADQHTVNLAERQSIYYKKEEMN